MRKEVLFAILTGIILGLIIVFGIRVANNSVNDTKKTSSEQSETTPTITPEATVTTSQSPTETLQILSPANHQVIFTNTVAIKGKTTANTKVAIVSQEDDRIISSDQNGNFSVDDFKLAGGQNKIEISSLNSQKLETNTQTLYLIYTTAKIN